MPLSSGDQFGRYQVLALAGTSREGAVYHAVDSLLDRQVAVKILDRSFAADRASRSSFALNHPNICAVYDLGQLEGQTYLVMEWLQGRTVREYIDAKVLDLTFALTIAIQVASALEAAHAAGIVHREIKPSNIFVDDRGNAKVLGFGLASELRTPEDSAYISPEQVRGMPVDSRSDLWSLGVVLYEMLTGSRPFDGPTEFSVVNAVVNERPIPIHDRSPRVPAELARVVDRLLQKDRESRYQSANELRADLLEVRRGDAIAPDRGFAPMPPPPAMPPNLSREPAADDDVQFTVYRPQSISPQIWKKLLVFAHHSTRPRDAKPSDPDPVKEVQRQARQILGEELEEYGTVSQDAALAITREGLLTFLPEVEGAIFQPKSQSVVWGDDVPPAMFLCSTTDEYLGKRLRGKVCVFLGNIVVAEVSISFIVENESATETTPKFSTDTARLYRKIFASYSHLDTAIVEEFERHVIAFGDEYLRDVTTLRAGMNWNEGLRQMIRDADVFQLFWSRNSMNSEYVQEEYRYALSLPRDGFIRPVYWENPLPESPEKQLPPPELRKIHFHRISPSMRPQPGTERLASAGSRRQPPASHAMIVGSEREENRSQRRKGPVHRLGAAGSAAPLGVFAILAGIILIPLMTMSAIPGWLSTRAGSKHPIRLIAVILTAVIIPVLIIFPGILASVKDRIHTLLEIVH
jgi:serine/threonine protein kinase